VPPPSTTTSRPGRLLAALAALLIVMLVAVLGANIASPGKWHDSFKVGLGLDLSWGTQITLQAYQPAGHGAISQGAMAKARQIMNDRIDSSGFVGASVVQQGANEIVVSVPHENAEQVANLVGTTAQLSFRQVLFGATNYTTSTTPSATPSTTPSPNAKASSSPKASSTPKTSSSPKATPSPSTGGSGQAASASLLSGKASSTAKPKASTTPTPTPTPSSSSSASAGQKVSTTADGQGDLAALQPQTVKDFNQLNCSNKHWQTQLYGLNPSGWNRPNQQAVGCYSFGGVTYKYAMAVPVIQGTDLSGVSAQAATSGAGYQVNFDVKSGPASRLGTLTEKMSTDYYPSASDYGSADYYLAQLAVVLDGQVQSSPDVQGQITTSGEISGPSDTGFTAGQANQLANLLKYGQLPLSFKTLDSSSVSPQLGSAQLSAGLIAGLVGLLLVVVYSFIYYRGLAVVSVSSLAIAAAISYLSVILLSKYESFNLSLAGIAGLIVAIGITADSFVVYFERLRDEVREGRSLRSAVERGWARARRTILVSDTVSFLAALLLYIFAIGDVRLFAFTLGLTTLVDIVVVFLFTKPMITLLARTNFYGRGHRLSGLDPARLGARAPWRGSRRPAPRPATGTSGGASAVSDRRANPGSPAAPKEA
jgi:preprotein translocase subunit SecD